MHEFWELTIGQFKHCIDGYSNHLESEAKQTDQLNHILGQYIRTGVADVFSGSNKYPEKPQLSTTKKPKQSIESFMQMAKQQYGKK